MLKSTAFSMVAKNSSLSTTADALLSFSKISNIFVKFNEVQFLTNQLISWFCTFTKFMIFWLEIQAWQAAMISVATMRREFLRISAALRAAVVPMLTKSSWFSQDGIESTLAG